MGGSWGVRRLPAYDSGMSTLAEIRAAADKLPASDKQELLLFLAAQLRREGQLPAPRTFTTEQMKGWIAEDERDAGRSSGGKAA